MMRSHLNNTSSNAGVSNTLIALAVLFVVIFGMDRIAPHLLAGGMQAIVQPVLESKALTDSYIADIAGTFQDKQALQEKNNALEKQLQKTRQQLLQMQLVKLENERLQERVGRYENTATTEVFAHVLARPPSSAYDTLLIDVGASNGISAGDRVFADQSVLLGKVVSVSQESARVRLFTSPREQTSAVIFGQATTTTTVNGIGGGNFRIRLPDGIAVSVGDMVVDARTQSHMLGRIKRINEESADSFQYLFARTPVNIQQLRYVTVITERDNE